MIMIKRRKILACKYCLTRVALTKNWRRDVRAHFLLHYPENKRISAHAIKTIHFQEII